jgi:drug/metabolite transporter (DMT)-like permease
VEAVALVLLVVLVLSGPLSHFFGADSRVDDPRGWWPGGPR